MASLSHKAVLFAMLWTCTLAVGSHHRAALHRRAKAKNDNSFDSVLAEEVNDYVADKKIDDLTHSIQQVFPKGATPKVSTPAAPKLPQVTTDPVAKAPEVKISQVTTDHVANAATMKVEEHVEKAGKVLDNHLEAVKELQAAIADQAIPKKAVQKVSVGTTAAKTKVEEHADKVGNVYPKVTLGAKSKLEIPGKVGHVEVTAVVNATQAKIEEAAVAMPMASFALDTPKAAPKKVEPPKFPGTPTQKAAFEKKEKSLETQLKTLKARLSDASDEFKVASTERLAKQKEAVTTPPKVVVQLPVEGKVGHINVSAALEASAKLMPKEVPKKFIDGKVGHIAVVTTSAPLPAPKVAENKSKAIEEAVVSLPMAGFAVETPKPTPKPVPKFPGTPVQKIAFEKKEKTLEDELQTLKARLTNASESLVPLKPKSVPVATGTFHASVEKAEEKDTKTESFLAPKVLEPMQPIIEDKGKKPKANWPTMASVAAPVALQAHIQDAVAPPQKEAIRNQESEDNTTKVSMGSTFTGTPAKKVQSMMALDAAVEPTVVAVATDVDNQAPPTAPVLGWFASIFAWFSGTPAAPEVVQKPKMALLATPKVAIPARQNRELTAQQVQQDNMHIFEVQDTWSQLEKDDYAEEEQVRRNDVTERIAAREVKPVGKPTKEELKARYGPAMSSFWKKLEKEDHNIEGVVETDDIVKYAELTQAQDERVNKASESLDLSKLHIGNDAVRKANKDGSDLRISIHDPWLARESKDKAVEKSTHDDPYLQMLQLKHHHKHK